MDPGHELLLIVGLGFLTCAIFYCWTTANPGSPDGNLSKSGGGTRTPLMVSNGGNFDFAIVGESNYQRHIAAANDEEAPVFSVEREPKNPYDRNAVVVKHKGRIVGYLARAEAEAVAPIFDTIERGGQVVTCLGKIKGGGPGRSFGVWLDLPPNIINSAS